MKSLKYVLLLALFVGLLGLFAIVAGALLDKIRFDYAFVGFFGIGLVDLSLLAAIAGLERADKKKLAQQGQK